MITIDELVRVLERVLFAGEPRVALTADTALMGSLPEFDSMAVVSVLTVLEDEYDIEVADDELSAETFASVQTLWEFLQA